MDRKFSLEKGIAILASWLMDNWGLLLPALLLLTILMILEYISNMLAAKKEALDHPNSKRMRWSSKKSINGIYKKVSYILVVLVAASLDFIVCQFASEIGIKFEHNTMFSLLVTIWLATTEMLSILENARRMGANLPNSLKRVLSELQSNIDEDSK